MTDTELYQIVKDIPPELWPEGLEHAPGVGWLCKYRNSDIRTGNALWIWEGKLSRFVSETYYEESADKHGVRWRVWHHESKDQPEYQTRIHGLVAAAIERHRLLMNDRNESRRTQ